MAKDTQVAQSKLPTSDKDVQHLRMQEALESAIRTRDKKSPYSDQDVTIKEIKAMSHKKGGRVAKRRK
jgi:hypothetical protein